MVACPTSLVGNWDNEIRRWVGDGCATFAVKAEPKVTIKQFLQHRHKGVLIISYDTQRRYSKMFEPPKSASFGGVPHPPSVDLLICDEAHKLKNADAALTKTLNALPARKRILLSGTPMQNELGGACVVIRRRRFFCPSPPPPNTATFSSDLCLIRAMT